MMLRVSFSQFFQGFFVYFYQMKNPWNFWTEINLVTLEIFSERVVSELYLF